MPKAPSVVALVLALTAALLAPSAGQAAITVYASYWDTEDLGEDFGLGARWGFSLAPRIQLEFGASYYEQFDRSVEVAGQPVELEVDAQVIPLDVGLRLDIGRRGGFYLGGGASYLLLDSDAGNLGDEFGWYGSLGFMLGRTLFVEGMYRQVEGTVDLRDGFFPDPQVTPGFDVDLTGVAVNVGFRF